MAIKKKIKRIREAKNTDVSKDPEQTESFETQIDDQLAEN